MGKTNKVGKQEQKKKRFSCWILFWPGVLLFGLTAFLSAGFSDWNGRREFIAGLAELNGKPEKMTPVKILRYDEDKVIAEGRGLLVEFREFRFVGTVSHIFTERFAPSSYEAVGLDGKHVGWIIRTATHQEIKPGTRLDRYQDGISDSIFAELGERRVIRSLPIPPTGHASRSASLAHAVPVVSLETGQKAAIVGIANYDSDIPILVAEFASQEGQSGEPWTDGQRIFFISGSPSPAGSEGKFTFLVPLMPFHPQYFIDGKKTGRDDLDINKEGGIRVKQ